MAGNPPGSPRRINGLLKTTGGDVHDIERHTRWLVQTGNRLQWVLPERLRGHWQLAAVDVDALVLVAESPAWATPLRGYQQALLDAAAEVIGQRPAALRIRLAKPVHRRPKAASPPLSAEAIRHLQNAADGMVDPRLADGLRRLASRRRGR
jgi:hypothetical protein